MEDYKVVGWASYDDAYPNKSVPQDEVMNMVSAVIQNIAENGYCFSGQEHQNGLTGMPVFADGTAFRASMRSWGLIMASAHSDEENQYNYMDFYMYSALEEKTPDYENIEVKPYPEDDGAFELMIEPDLQLVEQSLAGGMALMTTDKAIQRFYDFRVKLLEQEKEE